jgi:hypothetical protein
MAMPIRLPQDVCLYAWRGLTRQILENATSDAHLSLENSSRS